MIKSKYCTLPVIHPWLVAVTTTDVEPLALVYVAEILDDAVVPSKLTQARQAYIGASFSAFIPARNVDGVRTAVELDPAADSVLVAYGRSVSAMRVPTLPIEARLLTPECSISR